MPRYARMSDDESEQVASVEALPASSSGKSVGRQAAVIKLECVLSSASGEYLR